MCIELDAGVSECSDQDRRRHSTAPEELPTSKAARQTCSCTAKHGLLGKLHDVGCDLAVRQPIEHLNRAIETQLRDHEATKHRPSDRLELNDPIGCTCDLDNSSCHWFLIRRSTNNRTLGDLEPREANDSNQRSRPMSSATATTASTTA